MRALLIIIGILLLGILIYLTYYGLFNKVDIKQKEIGQLLLVYEDFTGDYKLTNGVMDKVYHTLLRDDSIISTLGFGIYYDDPRTVPAEKLRSKVGCILDPEYHHLADTLSMKYTMLKFPEQRCLVAEFPFKGKMSIMMAILFKVYPKLNKAIKLEGYEGKPIMEIYDVIGKKITFIVPSGDIEEYRAGEFPETLFE